MIKNIGNAEQIRNEILRRLQESADLGETCRDCDIPLPRPVDPAANRGCNWIIDAFPGVSVDCLPVVKSVTAEMMREYDLR